MFTIKTIIQQQVNGFFGRVTKIKSFNLYFLNERLAVYVVILKNRPETMRVYIPLNGEKPYAINHTIWEE